MTSGRASALITPGTVPALARRTGFVRTAAIIVGAPEVESVAYIRSAAEAARTSPYTDRLYFSFNENGKPPENLRSAVDLLSSFTNQVACGES